METGLGPAGMSVAVVVPLNPFLPAKKLVLLQHWYLHSWSSPFRYHLKSQFLQLSSHKGTGLPATHRGGQRSAQSCIGGVTEMQQFEQKRFHPGYRAELQHHELGGLPSMGEQRIQGPGQLPLVQNVFSLKRKKKKTNPDTIFAVLTYF